MKILWKLIINMIVKRVHDFIEKSIVPVIPYILVFGIFIVFFFYYEFFLTNDGFSRYLSLQFMQEGRLKGYPSTMLFFAYPFYLLDYHRGGNFWINHFNTIIFMVGVVSIYIIIAQKVNRKLAVNFMIFLVFGSMFAAHLRHFYGEVFTAMFFTIGVMLIAFYKNLFLKLLGSISVILAVTNTPGAMIGLALFAVVRAFDTRRLRVLLLPVIAFGLILLENKIKRGDFFVTGYEGTRGSVSLMYYSGLPNFSYPFLFGLLSIIFSFGQGILFYAPGMFLPYAHNLTKKSKELFLIYRYWIFFIIGLILIYSRWWAWFGGGFGVPRFFLLASVPSALSLAYYTLHRPKTMILKFALVILVFFTFYLGVNSALLAHYDVLKCYIDGGYYGGLCIYIPEYSHLWAPFTMNKWIWGEMDKARSIAIITLHVLAFIYVIYPTAKELVIYGLNYTKNSFKTLKQFRI